jgi:phage terminase large subunit-like protein
MPRKCIARRNIGANRIDFYRPNKGQKAFHDTYEREVALRAGNQLGKTTAGAAHTTFDSLGLYPEWYEGRRHVVPKIERPYDFIGWAASTTSITTRDGEQVKLLGDVRQRDGLGTGMIPLDNIVGRPTMARGISDFVDTVTLRRDVGGSAIIRFKTYEMDRQAFQGESVDLVWLDEDPGDDIVYSEALARLTATNGRIILTATPVLGRTPLFKRFASREPGTIETRLRMADAEHIPAERRAEIAGQYNERERATRVDGEFMQGAGAVFMTPENEITHSLDPRSVPAHWPWLWGVDFSHAGESPSAHPFAAVLCCYHRESDTIYVMHAIKAYRMLAAGHVALMQRHPCWDAKVAWPHDGNLRGLESGKTISQMYRQLGLNMCGGHATLPGSTSYETAAGIRLMTERFAKGRLKIAAHLTEVLEEYRHYHYENNQIVKEDDDLMSALRTAVISIGKAEELAPRPGMQSFWRDPQSQRQQRYAKGSEMNQPFDLFTGRSTGTPSRGGGSGWSSGWDIFSGGKS